MCSNWNTASSGDKREMQLFVEEWYGVDRDRVDITPYSVQDEMIMLRVHCRLDKGASEQYMITIDSYMNIEAKTEISSSSQSAWECLIQ